MERTKEEGKWRGSHSGHGPADRLQYQRKPHDRQAEYKTTSCRENKDNIFFFLTSLLLWFNEINQPALGLSDEHWPKDTMQLFQDIRKVSKCTSINIYNTLKGIKEVHQHVLYCWFGSFKATYRQANMT